MLNMYTLYSEHVSCVGQQELSPNWHPHLKPAVRPCGSDTNRLLQVMCI